MQVPDCRPSAVKQTPIAGFKRAMRPLKKLAIYRTLAWNELAGVNLMIAALKNSDAAR